jgi:hypothetical protein
VADLSCAPASVTRVVLGDFQGRWAVPWSDITLVTPDSLRMADDTVGAAREPLALSPHEVMLVRDVLDTRVYDVRRRRSVRVGDVWLDQGDDGALSVAGLEVGSEVFLRRLGVRRRVVPSRPLPLSEVHLTSLNGHRVQLATPSSSVHGLAGPDLAHLLTHIPMSSAVDVVRHLPAGSVSQAVEHLHPHVVDRLRHALDGGATAPSRRLRRTAGWRTYRPGGGDVSRRTRAPGSRP